MEQAIICGVCGELLESSIMISNGIRVCAEHHIPLMSQSEIDNDDPPHYEIGPNGYWIRADSTEG